MAGTVEAIREDILETGSRLARSRRDAWRVATVVGDLGLLPPPGRQPAWRSTPTAR